MRLILMLCIVAVSITACKKEDKLPQDSNNTLVVLTDQAFDDRVTNGSGVAMVFYHAAWCHICEDQRPHVEEAVGTAALNDVFFGEIDHVDYPGVFTNEGVSSFPTLYIYVDGEFKTEISTGSLPIPATKIKEALEEYL